MKVVKIIILFVLLTFLPVKISASSMSNSDYIFDILNPFDIKNEEAGFIDYENSNNTDPIIISHSQDVINYQDIVAGEPILRSSNLNVTGNILRAYSILIEEDHELTGIESQAKIPDSTCDNGDCSKTIASSWKSPLTYGFGYRCEDQSVNLCLAEFQEKDYFKQFSNSSISEEPEVISNIPVGSNTNSLNIVYKVNINSTQPKDIYQNSISFILTPSY